MKTLPAMRGILTVILVLATLSVASMPALAKQPDDPIVLPGATSAEGIAVGRGSTFYAGDLLLGDIYQGDLQKGTAELFIDAPSGRQAAGLRVEERNNLLFVAGGFTGQGYVYDLSTGATVRTYQFADPSAPTIINDVALTGEGAWFTDSQQPRLYFVPIGPSGPSASFSTLTLSGPAAEIGGTFPAFVGLNGIAATPKGDKLIVAHTTNQKLYTVNPATGASAAIQGITLPNMDGILLEAGRLWAVQNFSNQISEIRLSPDLTSGVVEKVITSSLFQVPATVARHGNDLAAVNAKFDTGIPPTASEYEIIIVNR